jgi:hypothetical protein
MIDRWHQTTMRFRFQLGEWTFARRVLEVASLDAHFTELAASPESLALPLERFGDVWCYVVLSQPIGDKLPVLGTHQGTVRWAPHQYQHSAVKIEGDFEAYMKGQFPKDRTKKFRYKVRKLCQHVGNDKPWKQYRTPDEFREFWRHMDTLQNVGYQQKLLGKGLTDERAEQWAQSGSARGYLLFHGDKPIAYIAGRERDRIFYDEYIGYDPNYRDWSPGNVLQYFVLERVFADKDLLLWDFLEGEGQHKTMFGNVSQLCADLYFFPRRPKAMALFASQAGLHFASRGAVEALDRLQLKDKVKRMLRGQPAAGGPAAEATTGGGEST